MDLPSDMIHEQKDQKCMQQAIDNCVVTSTPPLYETTDLGDWPIDIENKDNETIVNSNENAKKRQFREVSRSEM